MEKMECMGRFFLQCTNKQKQAFLHVLKSIVLCTNKNFIKDKVYFEMCANYVSKCGSTRYSSYRIFPKVEELISMERIPKGQASMFGLYVKGKRTGKFYALPRGTYNACAETLSLLGGEALMAVSWVELGVGLPKGIVGCSKRSFKVNCPFHNDLSPSMVLWMNDDNKTGGGQCMVCHKANGTPLTVRVKVQANSLFVSNPLLNKNQNNIKPLLIKWGCLPKQLIANINGCLVGAYLKPDSGGYYRTSGHRLRKASPIEALLASEKKSKRERQKEEAQVHNFLLKEEPMKFPVISVSDMRPRIENKRLMGWTPVSQSWVVLDYDKVDGFVYDDCLAMGAGQIATEDRNLSGDFCLVQTSSKGVHAWFGLKNTYREPVRMFSMPSVRSWYAHVAKGFQGHLDKCSNSSVADMSSCAAGRFARRPSWRMEGEDIFRSRVLAHTRINK